MRAERTPPRPTRSGRTAGRRVDGSPAAFQAAPAKATDHRIDSEQGKSDDETDYENDHEEHDVSRLRHIRCERRLHLAVPFAGGFPPACISTGFAASPEHPSSRRRSSPDPIWPLRPVPAHAASPPVPLGPGAFGSGTPRDSPGTSDRSTRPQRGSPCGTGRRGAHTADDHGARGARQVPMPDVRGGGGADR